MPYTYLFLELAALLTVLVFTSPFTNWKVLFTKSIAIRILLLMVLWTLLDKMMVGLSIWSFPPNASKIQFLGLPIEEYGAFILHSITCIFLIQMYTDD